MMEGYKQTELGLLPKEWEVVRLREVVNIYDKKRIPLSSTQRNKMKGNYPYCGANGIIDYINDYIFEGEYLLLAEDGGFWKKFQNTSYMMNGKFWVNNHAHILQAKEGKSINKFLLYWLIYDDIESYTSGSTRKKLNQAVMKRILIPLPPLPEQRKIAYVLSAIQKAIEQQDKLIKTTTELKKALMQKLFTEGLPMPEALEGEALEGEALEGKGRKQKQTEIGPVPESWEVVKIGEIFDIQQGKQVSKKNRIGNNQKPFLRTANVLWGEIDVTILDKMIFTKDEEMKFKLLKNDILVCEGGDIGRTAICEIDMKGIYYQNHLHRLRVKKSNFTPKFFMYWMFYFMSVSTYVKDAGNVTTIPNLSKSRLSMLLMPKPKLAIQEEVIKIIESLDKKIEFQQKKKQTLTDLFKTMLHELMTGKRRVHEIEFGLRQAQPTNKKEELLPALSKVEGMAAEPEVKYKP